MACTRLRALCIQASRCQPFAKALRTQTTSIWSQNNASNMGRYLLSRDLNTHGKSTSNGPDADNIDGRRQLLNRLLYRSRQRGYLELDLILGKWAEENVEKLDETQLKSLVEVLDLENPELWKWLTGQEVAPEFLTTNPVFREIHKQIMETLQTHSPVETRAKLGHPWVRGWDDNRKVGGPQAGNQ